MGERQEVRGGGKKDPIRKVGGGREKTCIHRQQSS